MLQKNGFVLKWSDVFCKCDIWGLRRAWDPWQGTKNPYLGRPVAYWRWIYVWGVSKVLVSFEWTSCFFLRGSYLSWCLHCLRHLFHGEQLPAFLLLHFVHFPKTALADHVDVFIAVSWVSLDEGGFELILHPSWKWGFFYGDEHVQRGPSLLEIYLLGSMYPPRQLLALVLSTILLKGVDSSMESSALAWPVFGSCVFL